LIEGGRLARQKAVKVLHVGCANNETLPMIFRGGGWTEVKVEINPPLRPDLMTCIGADGLFEAVYSPQAITYLCRHDVALTLQDMHQVLKPTGFTLIRLPDVQELARHVAEGKLEERIYVSPTGPVSPLDLLYGCSVASGRARGTPRTGFTSVTLAAALISAGFPAVLVQRDPPTFSLTAIGFRSTPDDEQLATAQAQMLPAAHRAAALFTPPAR
jgi:hypothetical protein